MCRAAPAGVGSTNHLGKVWRSPCESVRIHALARLPAEVRYLVLPMRPAGTEGMNEEQLAEIVTRDSMIGTGVVHGLSAR